MITIEELNNNFNRNNNGGVYKKGRGFSLERKVEIIHIYNISCRELAMKAKISHGSANKLINEINTNNIW